MVTTKMADLLSKATGSLHDFLSDVLPRVCAADWWRDCVLKRLSHQQLRHVEQRGIDGLAGLDLAALVRVLDQNWYDINWKLNLPSDARHYVKEMQSIRNRWAHAGVDALPTDDIYRDLDTLQRFLNAIGAEKALLEEVHRTKQELLGTRSDDSPAEPDETVAGGPDAELERSEGSFAVTEIVHLKSDPAMQGPILGVQTTGAERRYQVFIDGSQRWFYESQLESCTPVAEGPQLVALDRFHAQLTALQIQHPGLSTLYSLNAARVDFIPYQFRPVLKFIKADRARLLIADGVGVGKTIEAGLILRELQARRDVRSVLIICPRPLVTEKKWLTEMKRFEERFTQLDGKALRFCISEMDLEGEWPDQHAKTILPYSLLNEVLLYGPDEGNSRRRRSKQPGLLDLDPPPRFDLVIVDEAHHIRNPNTFANDAVRFFCDNAEAVVFLTATPIQLGSDDLFELLGIRGQTTNNLFCEFN